jgi:hypothetical protein
LNEEAREFQWTSFGEALKLPINTPTRKLLDAVIELRGEQLVSHE